MRQKLMHTALSPDHPLFQEIFNAEEGEQIAKDKNNPYLDQEERIYPANYVPDN